MKTGLIAGVFDLGPHVGHLVAFEEALEHCDQLIIALHVRPEGKRVIEPVWQRSLKLNHSGHVSSVVPYETEDDLEQMIKLLKPDFRFLGSDYEGKPYTGGRVGTKVIYLKREHNISSSNLKAKFGPDIGEDGEIWQK